MSDEKIPPGFIRPPRHQPRRQPRPAGAKPMPGAPFLTVPGRKLTKRLGVFPVLIKLGLAVLAVQLVILAHALAAGQSGVALFEPNDTRAALIERYAFKPRRDLGLEPDHLQLRAALEHVSDTDRALWHDLRRQVEAQGHYVDLVACTHIGKARWSAESIPDTWQRAGCQALKDRLEALDLLGPPTEARPWNAILASFVPPSLFGLALLAALVWLGLPWVVLRYGYGRTALIALAGWAGATSALILINGVAFGRDTGMLAVGYFILGIMGAHAGAGLRRIYQGQQRRWIIWDNWLLLWVCLFILRDLAMPSNPEHSALLVFPALGSMVFGGLVSVWLSPNPRSHRKALRKRLGVAS